MKTAFTLLGAIFGLALLFGVGTATGNPLPIPDEPLTNTYWKIVRLAGEDVVADEGRREPHIILREEDATRRYSGTVGCNQIGGAYVVDGDTLTFSAGISTKMACLPPVDQLERRLIGMFAATARYHLVGDRLEFFDANGTSLASFQAVHL